MIPYAAFWLMLLASLFPQHAKPVPRPKETYRISGVVVDALSGQPLTSAEVSLLVGSTPPQEYVASQVSGPEGEFAFENLAAGKYTLNAQRRGYAPQAYLQHENYWTGITVGTGLNTSEIRFPLQPSASISGYVLDENGEAVRGASVMLLSQSIEEGKRATRMKESATSDDEGHFRFGHLLPGNYLVGVNAVPWYAGGIEVPRFDGRELAPDFERLVDAPDVEQTADIVVQDPSLDMIYPVAFFSNARDIPGASIITLQAGDAETADIRLQAIPAIHARVRVPGGSLSNVPDFNVSRELGEGIVLPVQPRIYSQGRDYAEITGLPPGRVMVVSSTQNGETTINRSQSLELSQDMELDPSQGAGELRVTGFVKKADGAHEFGNASIQLRNIATGEMEAVEISQNGEFSFQGMPGKYELLYSEPGWVARTIKATDAKVSGTTVELESGKEARLEVAVEQANGSVSGIAMKDGKPQEGVMILLVPQDLENNLRLIRRDQSDSDGSFALRAVMRGSYTVVAIEEGWNLEWTNPEVLAQYLAGGTKVDVVKGEVSGIKVTVQPAEGNDHQ